MASVNDKYLHVLFSSNLKNLQQDLTDNKTSVDELISGLEIFLRDHKDRLGPEQQELIQRGIYDLRSNFDKANYKAQDWLRRMEDQVFASLRRRKKKRGKKYDRSFR